MWVCRQRKGSASILPWGNYKQLPRLRLSLNGGWSLNWKGWLRIMRICRPRWFRSKRTVDRMVQKKRSNGPGWLTRWTPPQGGPLWDESGQFSETSWFLSLLQVLVLVPHTQWVKHSLPMCNQGQMPSRWHHSRIWWHHCPGVYEQPSTLGQHSASSSPHVRYPSHQYSSLASIFKHLPSVPNTRKGTTPLTPQLKVKAARGPVLALRKPVSAVGTALYLSSQQPATTLSNLSLSSSISPPIWSRLLLTLMTGWLCRPWEHCRSW